MYEIFSKSIYTIAHYIGKKKIPVRFLYQMAKSVCTFKALPLFLPLLGWF